MFSNTDESKKSFVERRRIERQQRELERIEKRQQIIQIKAVTVLQKWWRKRQQQLKTTHDIWGWWDKEYAHMNPADNTLTIISVFHIVGQYCLFSRHYHQYNNTTRLSLICKWLTNKYLIQSQNNDNNTIKVPFYTLLTDKRYQKQTIQFIKVIMNQCLLNICDSDSDNKSALYITGPELTTLLFYLNPSNYKPIKSIIDPTYFIQDPSDTLTKIAHSILYSTLDISMTTTFKNIKKESIVGVQLRRACVRRIERIVKLEKRSKQHGKALDKEDAKLFNGMKLWLSTVTRICLFSVDNALDTTEINQTAEYIWNYLLTVPLLTQHISSMILNHLRNWTLGAIYQLIKEKNISSSSSFIISGNGYLFITANLVDLYQEKIMAKNQDRIYTFQLMEIVSHLISMIFPFFSERQYSTFIHFHPLFKWSSCTWGNTIDSFVFEMIVQNQIATLWSKLFMDQLFEPVVKFQSTSSSPSTKNKSSSSSPSTTARKLFNGIKKNITNESDLLRNEANNSHCNSNNNNNNNNNNNSNGNNKLNMAEFSMDIQLIFSMYSQLGKLFTQQRKVILARIAFKPKLISQLWLIMNQFGPEGNMHIYLKAAKKNILEVEKEPLIDVLQIFCEACSLVFLTLDDIDIFQNEKPFTVDHLLNLSRFLNNFYFSLINHQPMNNELSESTVDINSKTQVKSSMVMQEDKQKLMIEKHKTILSSFQATRRLLLQIYDLDTRHPFCPPGHWLLISDPTTLSKQTFLRFLFFNTTSKNNQTEASQFLTQLRQGDVVSTRILQSMPHTIPFDTRLHIFRDWIQLDKASKVKRSNNVIRIRRQFILEDGLRSLGHFSSESLKSGFQVSFVNELGVAEAGIDQGGPFKDFVTLLIAEVFKPCYSLFSHTITTNLFYPSNISHIHGSNHIQMFEFIGKMIGKAVYEGILLDCQFARFFLAKLLGRNIFLEALQELDEDIWKNLIFLKHYEGKL
ncbi:unnamed protein product [Cunninghamella blakesleeana]